MDKLAQEENEHDEQNRGLELNRIPHAPLQVQEQLVTNVLDLFKGQSTRSQVILLGHGELIVVVIDIVLISLLVVVQLSKGFGCLFCLLAIIERSHVTCVNDLVI